MPKVSVIIPVYNAENYLRRCLDSVCNQTLKDIEIICVNDCSTDNSLDILQEYAQKDGRVLVIDCKTNGGESKARNLGLEKASGEYIAFVDNDDEIDLDFYEKLYESAKIKNADVAKGEVRIIDYNGTERYEGLNKKIRENNDILCFMHHWWTAIYKSSIIRDNVLRFVEGCPLGGDILFLNQFVLKVNSFVLVDSVFYHYYRREDSGDSKILPFGKIKSALTIYEMIVDNILQSPRFPNFSQLTLHSVFCNYLGVVLPYCYRCNTREVLDFCVEKAFSFYKKVAPYIQKDSHEITNFGYINILEHGDRNELKQFIIKNNSLQKIFMSNLRALHLNRSKTH